MFRRMRSDGGTVEEAAGTAVAEDAGAKQVEPRADTQPQTTQQRLKSMGVSPADRMSSSETDGKRRRRLINLRVEMHGKLLDTLNLSALDKVSESELRHEISEIVREELADGELVLSRPEFDSLVRDLVDEVLGLGPLEPLLADPTVTDILVNSYEHCYVERGGKLVRTNVQFKDNAHLHRIITKIVSAVGRRIDESNPWVDARLADGSRVNALVPPCAVDGPLLSIRKFSKKPFTVDKLIEYGAFSEEMALFMHACVRCRLN
ncbi:MAG: ATPase, T2SS/T4P/T4SS family, partial [Pseudomonadota bacterium]